MQTSASAKTQPNDHTPLALPILPGLKPSSDGSHSGARYLPSPRLDRVLETFFLTLQLRQAQVGEYQHSSFVEDVSWFDVIMTADLVDTPILENLIAD